MDSKRPWTPFALDAEVDMFGTSRIAAAHNELRSKAERLESQIKELKAENQRLREAVGWQPIETYKGGEVILYYPAEPASLLSKWVTIGRNGAYRKPSHWMPIPEPPASGEVGKVDQ